MWARRIEREIDLGQKPASNHKNGIKTFADLIDLIDLHIADMAEVGKRMGRSKSFGLDLLAIGSTSLRPRSRHSRNARCPSMPMKSSAPAPLSASVGTVAYTSISAISRHWLQSAISGGSLFA